MEQYLGIKGLCERIIPLPGEEEIGPSGFGRLTVWITFAETCAMHGSTVAI